MVKAGCRPRRLLVRNGEGNFMRVILGSMVLIVALIGQAALSSAAVVIQAEKAAVRTVGGPLPHGGWNLWSNGRVAQPLRFASAGNYGIVVRCWGSPAGGVGAEMALLVDGNAVKTITVGGAPFADYRFDVGLAAGIHEIAAAFLNDEIIGKEDRNLYLDRFTITPPPGAADPVVVEQRELAEAAEQREQEILAATQSAIEKNRKTEAKFRILNAAGGPVSGVKVAVEQISHEFLFGGNIYGFDTCKSEAQNAAYKRRFAELFNYATVGFYWHWYEPQRGKPNYAYTDGVVAWCREHGIRMKGHPLLWGNEAGIPTWSHGQPSPEIQRQRVQDIMGRYQGKIEFWEVVNEPSHLGKPKIDEPYRWARQFNPAAYLIVNDFQVLADGCPGFFRLLTEAKQNNVPFDGIGIQAHEPQNMRFPLDRVQGTLDHYATLGKQLHITEFTPDSGGQKIIDSQHGGLWDEAAQADYAVKFYRLCFAHPAMRAITWWDLSDQGSWRPGGGMLRADMSPKPVYEQLKRLIHEEWMTRLSATTDAGGGFSCRGFLGKYRIAIDLPGGKVEREIRITRDGPAEIVVRLPGS
jgi:GH35 family endo-1,4-beta-xylanase